MPVDRRPPPPAGRRAPGGASSPPRPERAPESTIDGRAAVKGIGIVVVTFIVGAFVFVQGLHKPAEQLETNSPALVRDPTPSPASSAATAASSPATTAAAKPPATKVAPAELAIVVGNAVDPGKPIASTVASKLAAAGYTAKIRRLDVKGKMIDRSTVHYIAPEWREDALAVARALGISDIEVTPLPNPAPVDTSVGKVFVIVGREPKALSEAAAAPTTTR
jgi:hypothetical protein